MMLCVVPREISRKVVESLARMYAGDPAMSVIVERRDVDRRVAGERRGGGVRSRSRIAERRRVHNLHGRRVAERRGIQIPSFGQLPLPRAARRFADRIAFCGLIGPSPTWIEEVESARLALAHQAGDVRAFETIYKMWFDRVYTFFGVVCVNQEDAEEALQRCFMTAYNELDEFDLAANSFRAWFAHRLLGSVEVRDVGGEEEDGDTRLLERWAGPPNMMALSWLGDSELLALIGRLPPRQRDVVALHYLFAMSPGQIAQVLGCGTTDVSDFHDRALRFMSGCVTSLGRRPGYSGRHPMTARTRPGLVILSRRLALAA